MVLNQLLLCHGAYIEAKTFENLHSPPAQNGMPVHVRAHGMIGIFYVCVKLMCVYNNIMCTCMHASCSMRVCSACVFVCILCVYCAFNIL